VRADHAAVSIEGPEDQRAGNTSEKRADQEAAHALRRQRTRQHPASGRPSAHGDRLYGRRLDTPLLEPPGFLLLNYGRQTLLGTIIAHIAHGAIVGGFASLSG
jgi:hypothetical protein